MPLVGSLVVVVVVFSDCCAGSVSAVSRNGVYMYSRNVSCVFNKSRLFLRYNCPRYCTIYDLGAFDCFMTCPCSQFFPRLIRTSSPALIYGKLLAFLS